MRSIDWLVVSLASAAALTACGKGSDNGAEAPRTATPAKEQRASVQTQALRKPCDWIPQSEVESVLGKLVSPPRLGYSAESPRPDDQGSACMYPIAGRDGTVTEVAVQVDPTGSLEFEEGTGMMAGVIAQELHGPGAEAPPQEKRNDGWDYAGSLPNLAVWRVGHVAVNIGGDTFYLPQETLGQLAAKVRGRIQDLPFAQPGADPNAAGSAPDPCALLTRAEAEAVLGKLVVEPYRSRESSPLADGKGRSCTYFTQGHRALVLTPTLSDGKTLFGMVGGMGTLIRSKIGGSDSADLLDGPWDQAASDSAGAFYFLKGDKVLEVGYRTSSTDSEGVVTLAQAAVGRL